MPITKREFQSVCYLHDGGTFVAQCWWLHNMEEKLVDIHCGGPDPSEEICESFRLEVRGVWSAWQRTSQRSSLFVFEDEQKYQCASQLVLK